MFVRSVQNGTLAAVNPVTTVKCRRFVQKVRRQKQTTVRCEQSIFYDIFGGSIVFLLQRRVQNTHTQAYMLEWFARLPCDVCREVRVAVPITRRSVSCACCAFATRM